MFRSLRQWWFRHVPFFLLKLERQRLLRMKLDAQFSKKKGKARTRKLARIDRALDDTLIATQQRKGFQ